MNVTIYKRPDGRTEVIDCRNVRAASRVRRLSTKVFSTTN